MPEVTAKTNDALFGHDEAEAMLRAHFAAGTLAHGWIIAGTKGTGKATLAHRFARHALSGGDAAAAARMAIGSHGDFLVIEPEYNEKKEEYDREISVDQAREIGQFLSLKAGEGAWRIVIVDSADQLNANGANAILKILEEPPPQALLLLVSHNPGRLLPTIRSRCHMLKLKPLSEEHFRQAVRHAKPDIDPMQLAALGQLSGYSPGIALELEEEGAVASYEQLLDLLSSLPALDALKLHAFAEQWASGTVHAKWPLLLRLILTLFERISKQALGAPIIPIADGEPQALARLSALHPPGVWALKWQQAADQFSMAESRHLDYKQVIITFFHSLSEKDNRLLVAS